MSVPELLGQIEERLRHRLEGSGLELQLEALGSGAPPLETPADSPLVRALEELTGHASGAVAYGTEAPYYRQMGMDAVVIGPGSIDQAHQPDEYLDLGQIKPAVNLFSRLIERFCCP
jgi:acetylornithine deacetylase